MKKVMFSLLCLVFVANYLPAQEFIKINNACNYDDEEIETEYVLLEASSEAQRIVMEILEANSMFFMPFILKEANVKNAQATFANKNKYILYNPVFLENFKKDAKTKWAAYSVLAHEIGHHVYGHDFTETNPQKRKTFEIQADNFSGSSLRKLGATFDEAQAGINTFALEGETNTHPSKSMRSTAIANGWKRQDDVLKENQLGETSIPLERQPSGTEVDQEVEKAYQYLLNGEHTKAFHIYYKYRNNPHFMNFSDLGYLYQMGYGVKQDFEEAIKWYRKAFEIGDPWGITNLGNMYANGQGVEQNYAEAIKLYQISIELGDHTAMNNLGRHYECGCGIEKNITEAVRLYRLAVAEGNEEAKENLKRLGYD